MAGFAGLVRCPFTAVICVACMFNIPAASDLLVGGVQAAAVSFLINAWIEPENLGLQLFEIFWSMKPQEVREKYDETKAAQRKEDEEALRRYDEEDAEKMAKELEEKHVSAPATMGATRNDGGAPLGPALRTQSM